ncbi:helix-turn-helix domain-containing protein [Rhizobium rhizogenes]|uniref:helix-turn-helix domain-containing protein n=1 Tax=Rhizobium rhizogenes TaxID=359 RepID=UPI003ED07B67
MSHDATNWAIKQRGLKPALKIVLWHLCDCYNPEHGAFPSQDFLSENCEVPRSTLNVYLAELERGGFIAREQRREKGSKRQERTRYYFPFEPVFAAKWQQNPCPETGHGAEEPVSRFSGEPSPENGASRVQILDSNLVKEPVREPVNLREGVREFSKEERKTVELRFWRLVKDWPASEGMPKNQWLREWFALTDEERDRAERRKSVWLVRLKEQRKSHVPAPSTYFREKLFDAVADPQAPAKPTHAEAAPFGKLWGAARFADLMRTPYGQITSLTTTQRNMVAQGLANEADLMRDKVRKSGWPTVNRLHGLARDRKPSVCSTAFEDIASGFVRVLRDSDVWWAWADEHERRGWPWLDDTQPMEGVYFPPIDNTLPLDAAVRTALDSLAGAIADIQKGKTHDAA